MQSVIAQRIIIGVNQLWNVSQNTEIQCEVHLIRMDGSPLQ
jgi:hypothetical protein